jgi:hypothetical protein
MSSESDAAEKLAAASRMNTIKRMKPPTLELLPFAGCGLSHPLSGG